MATLTLLSTVRIADSRFASILWRGRWHLARVLPCSGPPGSIVLSLTDITERKRTEEHQNLLLAELGHRIKNTLATVQSIASQTMRRSASLQVFFQNYSQRLQALARAHELLSSREWRSVHLREILAETLAPYEPGPDRIEIRGEDFELRPNTALSLSLVLHELTTNAVKHGALSSLAGRAAIAWAVTEAGQPRALRLTWRESGGPGAAVPAEHGFGLTLIDFFERQFESPNVAAIGLLVTSAFLVAGELLRKGDKPIEKLSALDTILIGLFQVLALFPGISRSGTTISAGLWRGLDRSTAARFSFLVGLPAIAGAGLLSIIDIFTAQGTLPITHYAAAFIAAAVTGYLCIAFLLSWLRSHSLWIFAVYCAAVGSLFLLFTTLS